MTRWNWPLLVALAACVAFEILVVIVLLHVLGTVSAPGVAG